MKKLSLLMGVLPIFALHSCLSFADVWHIEVVTYDVRGSPSIAIDSNDYPHISYYWFMHQNLKYVSWTGTTWDIDPVDDEGNVGWFSSLALDSNENPHISYYENTNEDLKCARWDGANWQIEVVNTEGDVGSINSIALDSNDCPHISYHDNTNEDLKYARWDGTSWQIESVDSEGDVGSYNSIALDSNDYPHISYSDYGNKDLKYARWNGGSWQIDLVDTEGSVGIYNSIALDSNDYPHISYLDATNYDLKYAKWNGGIWQIESVDTGENIINGYTSIALDSNNYPHISYYYEFYDEFYNLNYARWDGSIWQFSIIESDIYYSASNAPIAFDSSDHPHISYCDNGSEQLIHAWCDPNTPPSGFNLLSPEDGSYVTDTPTLDWEDSTDDDQDEVTYDLWYSEDSDFDPHEEINDLTDSTYTFPGGILQIGHTYYWKVRAWDGYEETWSGPDEYWSFTVNFTDIDLLSFSAEFEGDAVKLNWSVETTEDEEIAGFNLYRRELTAEKTSLGADECHRLQDEGWLKVNPSLITGENPHSYTDSDVEGGVAYEYKLEAVLADDSAETLGTTQATAGIPPASFAILALYPNPASDVLTCLLAVPEAGAVELSLYDLSGRLVLDKQVEVCEPTELEAQLNISSLASGVYTLRASFGGAEVSPACGGVAVVVR